jgi:hypothetical protein
VPCAYLVPTLPDPFLLFAARRNRLREVSYLTAVKRVLSKLYRRLMIEKLEHLPIPDG